MSEQRLTDVEEILDRLPRDVCRYILEFASVRNSPAAKTVERCIAKRKMRSVGHNFNRPHVNYLEFLFGNKPILRTRYTMNSVTYFTEMHDAPSRVVIDPVEAERAYTFEVLNPYLPQPRYEMEHIPPIVPPPRGSLRVRFVG